MNRLKLIALILIMLLPSASPAQKIAVPVDIQVSLFFKILTFDRNLKARASDEIVIGIFYQSRFKTSLGVKERFEQAINDLGINSIMNIPIRLEPIDIRMTDLRKTVSENGIEILYVTPLRAVEIPKIAEICRNEKILSLTGVPEYCSSGLAVGIGQKGEKPLIIINLRSAQEAGVSFRSQLLKLAKIVR